MRRFCLSLISRKPDIMTQSLTFAPGRREESAERGRQPRRAASPFRLVRGCPERQTPRMSFSSLSLAAGSGAGPDVSSRARPPSGM